ncbi:MAG: hypothetical protein K1V76_05195 [Candidatus Amulumruptor sp.]
MIVVNRITMIGWFQTTYIHTTILFGLFVDIILFGRDISRPYCYHDVDVVGHDDMIPHLCIIMMAGYLSDARIDNLS